METTGTPTLQELRRINNDDEMPDDVRAWAIECLRLRCDLIPEGTPAHERTAERLQILRTQEARR